MSIATRIESISNHLENAYDELQGLGADLTNVNKNIENISIVLDNIYDSMPQVSGEGTSLTLDNTRVGKIKSTLKGNASQDGTPTSTTPIPVNVVSGDNTIDICGKNMCNPNSNIVNIYFDQSTKNFLYNGNYRSIVIPIKPNTTYTISRTEGYGNDFSIATSVNYPTSGEYATNISIKWSADILTNTITSGANDNYFLFYFGYQTSQSTSREWLSKTQLEVGSSATLYEPYQSNTYNIDLPEDMELCKIGNYQDYFYKDSGKWYLHKEIEKSDLKDKGIVLQSINNYGIANFLVQPIETNVPDTSKLENSLCNRFSKQTTGIAQTQTEGFLRTLNANIGQLGVYIRISSDKANTVETFKAWLRNNPTYYYWALYTPTNTEITYQPLINQLNKLEKAQSKDNQTNISQENDNLPFIINATALIKNSD